MGVCLLDFFCSGVQFYLLLSPCLCFISFIYLDLYVLGDGALVGWVVFHASHTSECLGPHLAWGWDWRAVDRFGSSSGVFFTDPSGAGLLLLVVCPVFVVISRASVC